MSLPPTGVYSGSIPFTYLRCHSSLDSIFSQTKKLLLCAPAGSGKTLAVQQWLYAHHYRHEWVTLSLSVDERGIQSVDLLADLSQSPGSHPVPDCWIVTLSDGDALLQPGVEAALDSLALSSRLVVLTQRMSPDVQDAVKQSGFRMVDVDQLALSLEDLQRIVNLCGAGVEESGLSACLYALSRGWPALVFDLVCAGFCGEEQYRSRARDALTRALGEPKVPALKAVSILRDLEGMPADLMQGEFVADDIRFGMMDACTTGLLSLREQSGGVRWLRCSVLGELQLAYGRQVNATGELDAMISGLLQHGQQTVALPLLLRSGRIDQAEQAILAVGDALISRLRIHALFGWIVALDTRRRIVHPLILMLAVRCAFYAGKRNELEYFFEKLTQCLLQPPESASWQALSREHGQRLVAEYRLFARVVRPQAALPLQLDQAFAPEDASGDLFGLLQRALQCAEQGDIVTALPLIESGFQRTGVTRQLPLHLIFSILRIWLLVLSCQMRQAEEFLCRLKRELAQQSVVFLGIYEWLDVMDVLLLRIRGDIAGADRRVSQFLEQESFTMDFQKHYLLLNIKADIALAGHNFHEARHGISKLASLQQTSAKRSYWFACADAMKVVLDTLEGLHGAVPGMSSTPAMADLTEQTATLWSIKRRLFLDREFDPLPVLESLYAVFAQSGQWLRLLEVDVLRAVVLFRQGEANKASDLFGKVFEQLEDRGLLGVLIDPFLLWSELLQASMPIAQRQRIAEFHNRLRPQNRMPALAAEASAVVFPALSKREKQVLERVALGLSNLEIAVQLCVSITTVRTHLQNIYRKLDVYNRTEAAILALKHRLVQ